MAGGAFATTVRAEDPVDQVPTTSERLSAQDPDGTPYIVSHPEATQPTASEIEAQRKNDQKAAANQTWLLSAYEQQVQQKSANGDNGSNFYYRIVSDKNLSKLAGLPSIDAPVDPKTTLKTGVVQGNPGTLSLRPDAPAPTTTPTAPNMSLLTPLITPLGAADAAGLHNFYNTVPAATAPRKEASDPADLDMPGKIAADSNPLTNDSMTFDSLPDDPNSDKDKSSHHDDTSKSDLSLTSNVSKIQKQSNASLIAPGASKTVTQPNVSTAQLKLDEDPPSPKLVAPNVGRQPLPSPFSILDH